MDLGETLAGAKLETRQPFRPLLEEYLLKQVESVRSEILFKMQLVHRVGLAVITAPVIVLPIIARIQDYIPKALLTTGPNPLPSFTFSTMILLVSTGIPLLLLWAELFCISQTNGILRAGHWLRGIEEQLNISSSSTPICGWECWIENEGRRATDDVLTRGTRLALIALYYFASVLMICFLTRDYLKLINTSATPILINILSIALFSIFAGLFLIFLVGRRKVLYCP
ncbi:MAG: hypothetical protein WC853_09675 [Thermodesulfovibrionales bacterium]